MQFTDVIVIGAGQAGLAASRCLGHRGIDHVVLERGHVADRWHNERWSSLRLLTPNWMTRLPGHTYDGDDPGGFMRRDEVAAFLEHYARASNAPVVTDAPVRAVTPSGDGFLVESGAGDYRARAVIVATGACDVPNRPDWSARIATRIEQITTRDYRHPDQIASGGVLVVGASATGLQLAEELRLAGHDVTISVGRHAPTPRRWRGRDVMEWLDASGILSEPRPHTLDEKRALEQPSLQLVGSTTGRDISLVSLVRMDVLPVSRVIGGEDGRMSLSGDLSEQIARADRRRADLLARIDDWISRSGTEAPRDERPRPPRFVASTKDSLDFDAAGIRTVVWATGFRRSYPWLKLPVLDAAGELRHRGGVTSVPGLYALGLPFMRRRNSTFIDGVGADAQDIVTHAALHLGAGAMPKVA